MSRAPRASQLLRTSGSLAGFALSASAGLAFGFGILRSARFASLFNRAGTDARNHPHRHWLGRHATEDHEPLSVRGNQRQMIFTPGACRARPREQRQ
jgi:hypothetical protein